MKTTGNLESIYRSLLDWEPEALVYKEIEMMNNFFDNNQIKKVINVQERLKLCYDNKLKMASRYLGEKINYASFYERFSKYQVFVYEGKLYDTQGKLLTTNKLDFDTGAICVMTKEGALFYSHKKRGETHHSTLLSSAEVAYACMFEVKDGNIVEEKVWSGHYLPNESTQLQFHHRLKSDFAEKYDANLTKIFLRSGDIHSMPIPQCALSKLPLIDAVKLPCGHSFNNEGLKKWMERNQSCPFDNQSFELRETTIDYEKSVETLKKYKECYSKIQSLNIAMEKKVLELKLDDWDSRNFSVIEEAKFEFVTLFVKQDTTLNKISEIIKKLGLVASVKVFVMSGHTINDFDLNVESVLSKHKTNSINYFEKF